MGVGTNLGDRRHHLARALGGLSRLGRLDAVSSVWESEPVGWRDQPDYWNLVARLVTTMPPESLLLEVKAIEQAVGRRATFAGGPRIIDIDILLYGRRQHSSATLEIPHPRLMERAFVLRPLAELDPSITHPVTGESVTDRLATGTFERTRRSFDGAELLEGKARP